MKTGVSGAMLRWSVSAIALAAASLGAGASFAQDKVDSPVDSNAAKIEEVTVTARKREESIKDVPIAITAVSMEQAKMEGVTDLYSLALTVPGFTAQSIGGTYQAPVLRGLSQVDQTAVIGNVGVFVDGVYLNNRDGLDFGFLDLSRVEILKGPQSALYGENTFSGAVDYVTKAPALNRYDGFVTAGVGNDGFESGQGSLNVPIFNWGALRLAGGRSTFDGTIPDTLTGGNIGGWKSLSTYSASLLIDPISDVRIRAFYERTDSDMDQVPYVYLPTTANNCGDLVPGPNGNRYSLYCGKLPVPTTVALEGSPASGLVGFNAVGYVSGDWDMKWATLSATASYTNARFSQFNDVSGNPKAYLTPFFPGSTSSDQEYLEAVQPASNETAYDIKLTSPSGQKITWMGGFFTYTSQVDSILALFLTPIGSKQPLSTPFFGDNGNNSTIGRALYGVFGYDITDRWNVRAEGRVAEDDQKFVVPQTPNVSGRQTYNYFLPRVSTTFKLDPDNNIYASVSEGYKLGGFNANAYGLPQFTFGPEKNWTYEIGMKGSLLDHKLQYDGDIYYISWTGIQIQENIPASTISVTQTDKGATDYGIELTSTYYFTPNLWVRAGFTVLHPTYISGTIDGEVLAPCGDEPGLKVITKGCSSLVGGDQLARTSDAQADFSAQWTLPNLIGKFSGYVHGDYSWQAGIHYFSIANDSQGDISLVNGRAGLTNNNIEFAVWVKNLLDSEYLARSTSTQSNPDGTGVEATRLYPAPRRTFGVEATYRF